jgi:hypothetical protein
MYGNRHTECMLLFSSFLRGQRHAKISQSLMFGLMPIPNESLESGMRKPGMGISHEHT